MKKVHSVFMGVYLSKNAISNLFRTAMKLYTSSKINKIMYKKDKFKKLKLMSKLTGCEISEFVINTRNQQIQKIVEYWDYLAKQRNNISHGNCIHKQLSHDSEIINKIRYLNENFFETFMLLHNEYIASSDKNIKKI